MRASLLPSLLLLAAAAAPAQTLTPEVVAQRRHIVDEMVTEGARAARAPVTVREPFLSSIADFAGNGELLSYLLTARLDTKAEYKKLLDQMEARVDKQIGAPASGSGTTSLTSKGLVPQILGAAVEQGAFTRDVSGTTVTFRVKPLGLVKFLQGKGLLDQYSDYDSSPGVRFASRFSGAASFDTSRGGQAGTLTADRSQFSAWSVRGELVNHRDPAAGRYAARWRHLLDASDAVRTSAQELGAALGHWPAFTAWHEQLKNQVKAMEETFTDKRDPKAPAAFRVILEARLPELDQLTPLPADVALAVDHCVAALAAVEGGMGDIYAFANKGLLITAELNTTRDPKLPDLYTATALVEFAAGAQRKTDISANVALNYFKTVPTSASRKLKSFAASAELERPLGSVLGLRSTTFALSGRYSYLPRDTVAVGDAGAALKGGILVFQAKLTVPAKGTAVKIPLSVSWANRTEAVNEKFVRAHFGVTFDLDTLMAAAKANN